MYFFVIHFFYIIHFYSVIFLLLPIFFNFLYQFPLFLLLFIYTLLKVMVPTCLVSTPAWLMHWTAREMAFVISSSGV